VFYDFVSSATLFIRLENKTKNLSILNLFFFSFFFPYNLHFSLTFWIYTLCSFYLFLYSCFNVLFDVEQC
jgi:hypothetical protein